MSKSKNKWQVHQISRLLLQIDRNSSIAKQLVSQIPGQNIIIISKSKKHFAISNLITRVGHTLLNSFKINPPPRSPRLRAKKSLINFLRLDLRNILHAEERWCHTWRTRRREEIQLSVETPNLGVSTALLSLSWLTKPPQSHFAPTTHHQKNKYRNESA